MKIFFLITIYLFILFFSGCEGKGEVINIIGTWGGSELESFNAVCEASGEKITFETTRDLNAVLNTRVEAGNLPDIAVLPNPAKLKELVIKGKLKPLDFMDKNFLSREYAKSWIDLGSYGGKMYGIFYKIANKSLIWYNPAEFSKNRWEIPSTWKELLDLTDHIRKSGKTPWSIGADTGWPLTDWIENIMVRKYGPEVYRKWIDHEISWRDEAVRGSFLEWEKITGNPGNLLGGRDGTLSSTFQNAALAVFSEKPGAYMYFEGDFIGDIVRKQLPEIQPGKNIDSFPFPPIDQRFGNPVVAGGDVIVIFRDKPSVRKLINFLASREAHEIWVKRGGFISPNRNVPLESYPDALSRKSAEIIAGAESVVFDASDLMPSSVGNQDGFWDAAKRFVKEPEKLDMILDDMENIAEKNY